MTIYYYIYETTNLLNNKVYIGAHRSETLDFDHYLGSGKYLKHAVSCYGKENFSRKTIEIVAVTEKTLTHRQWNDIVHPRESFWINYYKDAGSILYNINSTSAFGGSTTHKTKWIHNKATGEHKMVSDSDSMPEGFEYGRLHDTKTKQTGSLHYHNTITGEEKRFKTPPSADWVKGSLKQKVARTGSKNSSYGKKWYMNLETKKYTYTYIQPENFVLGHPDWRDPSKMVGWSKL